MKHKKMTNEELSVAVNLIKLEYTGVFKVEDIRNACKNKGIPMYSEFATTLVRQGIIVQAGLTFFDGYMWSNSKPIHISKIAELMSDTRKKVAKQAKNYHQKKKGITPESMAINEAIKLLLDNGYKVSKPVVTYEDVVL